jgi:adenosylcobinamide-phosphate synthase
VTSLSAALTVVAGALAIDLVFGDPPNRWHPVAWLGSIIAAGRRRLASGSPLRLLVMGALLTIGVATGAALAGTLTARGAALGPAGIVVEAVALSACLSVRGLWRAASQVARALDAGDLSAARAALSFHLVSRPSHDLSAGEVAAATVESVAENLTDSVLAPALFYLAFGLPGAALYRAINTADAMIGYRDGVLEHFGKLAARADDVLNVVPARLAALAIVVAALFVGASPGGALAALWRDRGRTASPNAGWTMAAMAGALRVRLVKRSAYVLGDGPLPTSAHIHQSLRVVTLAFVLAMCPIIIFVISIAYR